MMRNRNRAISTVMDVALGLLLVSAAVGLIAAQMNAQEPEQIDTNEADHTVEAISQLTLDVTYQVHVNGETYTFTRRGNAARHLRRAVLLDSNIGTEPVVYETNYPEKVAEKLTAALRGAKHNYHVTAQWRPYETQPPESSVTDSEDPVMHGEITIGPDVRPQRNVSSAETFVLSEMETGESIHDNPTRDELSRELAEIIVNGYFPVTETQLKLDQSGEQRQYVAGRYLRMAAILEAKGGETEYLSTVQDLLAQTAPRAFNVNNAMVELMTPVIRADIESADTMYVREQVKTGRVEITVKTWE